MAWASCTQDNWLAPMQSSRLIAGPDHVTMAGQGQAMLDAAFSPAWLLPSIKKQLPLRQRKWIGKWDRWGDGDAGEGRGRRELRGDRKLGNKELSWGTGGTSRDLVGAISGVKLVGGVGSGSGQLVGVIGSHTAGMNGWTFAVGS